MNSVDKQSPSSEEMVTVVDRRGRKKTIPRSEYERKKKGKKKREKHPTFSFKTVLSVAVIIVVMFIAAYIAFIIVE